MTDSKLQYKCERHGVQDSGFLITLRLADGNVHSLNHCLACVAEMLSRNGVTAMTPILQAAALEEKSESWIPKELVEK